MNNSSTSFHDIYLKIKDSLYAIVTMKKNILDG